MLSSPKSQTVKTVLMPARRIGPTPVRKEANACNMQRAMYVQTRCSHAFRRLAFPSAHLALSSILYRWSHSFSHSRQTQTTKAFSAPVGSFSVRRYVHFFLCRQVVHSSDPTERDQIPKVFSTSSRHGCILPASTQPWFFLSPLQTTSMRCSPSAQHLATSKVLLFSSSERMAVVRC